MTDVALVTGATSGIGRETARGLAERGWTVLVHGRDRERGRAVRDAIERETPGDARFYCADLADFAAVRDLAERIADEHDRLDALVNNAATWQRKRRLIDATGEYSDGTRAGVELTMAVTHCGHYLLTHELWPLLVAGDDASDVSDRVDAGNASDEVDASDGRVVTVSSSVHRQGRLDTDRFVGPEGPTGQQAYADSKLANVAFTGALARRTDAATATCCHPGVVPSTLLTRDSDGLSKLAWKTFGAVFRPLPFGPVATEREAAETSIYLATTDVSSEGNGWYFADSRPKKAADDVVDRAGQEHLWDWTADVVGVDPEWPKN